MKKCVRCLKLKAEKEFYPNPRSKDGLQYSCITCIRLEQKSKPKTKRVWTPFEKQRDRRYKLKGVYGLTEQQVADMSIQQEHRCAICGIQPLFTKLEVDHSHETGQVRELLCGKCNKGLGLMREDIEILEKAIQYLIKHTCKSVPKS